MSPTLSTTMGPERQQRPAPLLEAHTDESAGVEPEALLRWAAEVAFVHVPDDHERTRDPAVLVKAPAARPAAAVWRGVPAATLRRYLDELLVGPSADLGLEALRQLGVLDAWLPEVAMMVGFSNGEGRHKDVWRHTLQVVRQAVPRLVIRWGALLHDIGKVRTRRVMPDGTVHFHGHAEVGAADFRKRIAGRLAFDAELGERIHYLILHHLRAGQYDGSWTDSAVRRFAKDMGDGLHDLLDLSRADITTKRLDKRKRALALLSELAQRVEQLVVDDAKVPPLPKGLGGEICRAFNLAPSKRIGELRDALEEAIHQGQLEPGQPAEYYLAWLASHRDEFAL